ncbi:caspase family protein [Chondrinema litorale]|uniref:caspase family protein n=1 Tax=Chondrinema litorale TaxID=2994555 RepID=UPI002542AD8E|nr:caspase family protein [Chondrinema litorale]UZR98848.1 caspase family protein [Chondrinema litorale]
MHDVIFTRSVLFILLLSTYSLKLQAQADSDYAIVHIYRSHAGYGANNNAPVLVNEKQNFELTSPGRLTLKLSSEGNYSFKTVRSIVSLDIKKGKEYFLEVYPALTTFKIGHPKDYGKAKSKFEAIGDGYAQTFIEDPKNPLIEQLGDYAMVHIYRKNALHGAIYKTPVVVNDKKTFDLSNADKLSIKVHSEGKIKFRTLRSVAYLDVKHGNEYYLEIYPALTTFKIYKVENTLSAVNSMAAIPEKNIDSFEEDINDPFIDSANPVEVVEEETELPKTEETEVIDIARDYKPVINPELLTGLTPTSTKNENAIAVVIGNALYEYAKPVDFAINDATAVKKYLVDVFGFLEGNIYYLENASKGDFERFFGNSTYPNGKLFNSVRANLSDVFVFYSGHGAPGLKDQKGYFVPVECDPQYVELSGYSLDVFYKNLSQIPAKSMTVVLDACFSGADVYENISPIVIASKGADGLKNGIVLSSTSENQVATWYNDKGHGMFTYFFLKALQNKNADYNKDKAISYEELFKYVSDKNYGVPYYSRRLHGVEQDPVIQGENPEKVMVSFR